MTRVLKLVAAGVAAAAAIGAAFLLHLRAGARRRDSVKRETAGIATLFATPPEPAPRLLRRRRVDDGLEDRARQSMETFGDAAGEITVRAQDGVVTMRGEVDHLSQITRYEEAMRAVPGVVDVDNLLRLRLAGVARPRVLTA